MLDERFQDAASLAAASAHACRVAPSYATSPAQRAQGLSNAYSIRSNALYALGMLEPALLASQFAIGEDPKSWRARDARACCLISQHRVDEALASFSSALQLLPAGVADMDGQLKADVRGNAIGRLFLLVFLLYGPAFVLPPRVRIVL